MVSSSQSFCFECIRCLCLCLRVVWQVGRVRIQDYGLVVRDVPTVGRHSPVPFFILSGHTSSFTLRFQKLNDWAHSNILTLIIVQKVTSVPQISLSLGMYTEHNFWNIIHIHCSGAASTFKYLQTLYTLGPYVKSRDPWDWVDTWRNRRTSQHWGHQGT